MVGLFETNFWVATLAWLPGVLWGYELALQRLRWGGVILAALALGLATLGGQFSFVLVFDLCLLAYALVSMYWSTRQARRLDYWPLLSAVLILGLGTMLAAPQILPFYEALQQSHRALGSSYSPIPWRQVITWLVPDFYGNPTTTRVYWGALNFAEGVLYAGLATVLLALLSLASERHWRTYFYFALVLLFLYFSLGGPGVRALVALPLIRFVPLHRSVFIVPLFLAHLAAASTTSARLKPSHALLAASVVAGGVLWALAANWGDARSHLPAISRPLLVVAAAVLVAALVLLLARERWPAARTRLNWGLAALTFFDLFLAGSQFNPALPAAQLPPATPAIEYLQAHADPYRVASLQEGGEILFGPNYLSVFGPVDLSGYSSLLPARLRAVVQAGDPAAMRYNANAIWLSQPSLRLLDLLQTGHIVSRAAPGDLGLRT